MFFLQILSKRGAMKSESPTICCREPKLLEIHEKILIKSTCPNKKTGAQKSKRIRTLSRLLPKIDRKFREDN